MPQQTYTVTAPNGRTLDITGDRVPTEVELRDIFKAAGVEIPDTPAQPPPEHPHARTARLVGEAARGVKAGALSTVYHGGDLLRRGWNAVMPDALDVERVIERPEVQALITPPQTPAGKVGFYGEQAAEFTVPLAKVARITKGAPILQRMAAEGAASAGVAGVQSGGEGGNMAMAGALGAVAPPAAAVVRGGVNMVRNAAASAREGGLGGAVAAAVRRVSSPEARMMLVQGLKPANKQINFMRTLDQAMPEIKAAEQSLGKPIENIDDLISATQTAKRGLMTQYSALSGGQKAIGALVDGEPIANAMVKSIPKKLKLENPKAAEALIEKADTYRRAFNLDELEQLLVETNAELDGFYSQFPFAQRAKLAANPQAASLEAQARSMRDAIYKTLDVPGEGVAARELKRRYGALMEVEQTAMRRANVAKRQQPESLAEQLSAARAAGEIAKGTYKILRGDLMGAADIAAGRASREAAKFLKEQQTTDALIRRAFAGFEGTPKPIPMPQQRPIRGLLPNGPMVTPPPADASYVRSVPARPVVPERKALPPKRSLDIPQPDRSSVTSARADFIDVINPRTGQTIRVYLGEASGTGVRR